MDFTREPIIETVITPKEGCKLVVRSSKSNGQEEHFVDAVEVVSFGHSFFFRSLERPKTFLVPATDYEILEVREARMVLKNVGIDRAIKIGGGREAPMRAQREQRESHAEKIAAESGAEEGVEALPATAGEKTQEGRTDRKRERRRKYRSRRGREGGEDEAEGAEGTAAPKAEGEDGRMEEGSETPPAVQQAMTTSILTSLLPPPPTLISETIARYKDNALFKDVFYSKEEPKESTPSQEPTIPLHQPEYGTFEITEEEEEEIYQQRKRQTKQHEEPIQNNNHEHEETKGFPFDEPNSAP